MSLPVISLWEPWATLVALRLKRIETRGWYHEYRGPVVIHATAAGMTQEETFLTCRGEPFRSVLIDAGVLRSGMSQKDVFYAFPRGKIIAVGNIVDWLATEARAVCEPEVFCEYPEFDTPQERAFGNYDHGRFGVVFDQMFQLPRPIPFKSRQGKLIELDPATEAAVREQWKGF